MPFSKRRRRIILPAGRRLALITAREAVSAGPLSVVPYLLVGTNGTTGTVYYSMNGTDWVLASGVPATMRPQACAGSGRGWIVTGFDSGGTSAALYSATGKSFTSVSIPDLGGGNGYQHAAWSSFDSVYVATGYQQPAPYTCAVSSDGQTWVSKSIAAPVSGAGGPIGSIAGRILFGAPNALGDSYYSTDAGATWSHSVWGSFVGTTRQLFLPWNGSVFVNGDMVNASPIIQRTSTGVTGANTTVAGNNGQIDSIGYSGTQFIGLGPGIYSSADGITWAFVRAGPATRYRGLVLDSPNSRFLAITTNAFCALALDGSSFTEGALPTGAWLSVAYVTPLA